MSFTPLAERPVTEGRQELLDAAIREWMVRSSTAAEWQVDRLVREARVRNALQGLIDAVAAERRPAVAWRTFGRHVDEFAAPEPPTPALSDAA